MTASGVHDPESPGGKQGNAAGLGSLIGFQEAVSQSTKKFDMIDGNPYDPDKAYKDSKVRTWMWDRIVCHVYMTNGRSSYIYVLLCFKWMDRIWFDMI